MNENRSTSSHSPRLLTPESNEHRSAPEARPASHSEYLRRLATHCDDYEVRATYVEQLTGLALSMFPGMSCKFLRKALSYSIRKADTLRNFYGLPDLCRRLRNVVIAHLRHERTNYDALLSHGCKREHARYLIAARLNKDLARFCQAGVSATAGELTLQPQ